FHWKASSVRIRRLPRRMSSKRRPRRWCGDTTIRRRNRCSRSALRSAFLPAEEIEQALLDVFKEVKDKGTGGHILTGPIYIDGAMPGDTLEVRIKEIKLAIPYGYSGFIPKRGFLPEDFDRRRTRIIRLDHKRMVGHFAKGIEIPLRPFFGCLGVAPPPE